MCVARTNEMRVRYVSIAVLKECMSTHHEVKLVSAESIAPSFIDLRVGLRTQLCKVYRCVYRGKIVTTRRGTYIPKNVLEKRVQTVDIYVHRHLRFQKHKAVRYLRPWVWYLRTFGAYTPQMPISTLSALAYLGADIPKTPLTLYTFSHGRIRTVCAYLPRRIHALDAYVE